jgi:hypothetical protein
MVTGRRSADRSGEGAREDANERTSRCVSECPERATHAWGVLVATTATTVS